MCKINCACTCRPEARTNQKDAQETFHFGLFSSLFNTQSPTELSSGIEPYFISIFYRILEESRLRNLPTDRTDVIKVVN